MSPLDDNRPARPGRITRSLAWLADGLLMVGVCLILALQLAVVQSMLKGVVLSSANSAITGNVKVERLTGPLPFGVQLEGVELSDAKGRPMARATALRADVSIPSLLTGSGLRVHSVRLRGLRAFVHRRPDGSINLMTLTEPSPDKPTEPSEPSDAPAFWIDLESIDIDDVRAVWVDETVTKLSEEERPEGAPSLENLRRWATAPDSNNSSVSLEAIRTWRKGVPGAPAIAAIDDLGLRAGVATAPDGVMGATVGSLRGRVAIDRIPGLDRLDVDDVSARYDPGSSETPAELAASLDRLALSKEGLVATDVRGRIPLVPPSSGEGDRRDAETYAATIGELRVAPDFATATGLLTEAPLEESLTVTAHAGGRLEQFGLSIVSKAGDASISAAARGGWGKNDSELTSVIRWDKLNSDMTPLLDDGLRSSGSVNLSGRGPQSVSTIDDLRETEFQLSLLGGKQAYGAMSLDSIVADADWNGARLDLSTFEVRGALGQVSATSVVRPWGGRSSLDLEGHVGSDQPGHPLTDYLGGRWSPGDGTFSIHATTDRHSSAFTAEAILDSLKSLTFDVDWDIRTFQFPGIKIDDSTGDVAADIRRESSGGSSESSLSIDSHARVEFNDLRFGDFTSRGTSVDAGLQTTRVSTDDALVTALLAAPQVSASLTAQTDRTKTTTLSTDAARLDVSTSTTAAGPEWRVSADASAASLDVSNLAARQFQVSVTSRVDPTAVTSPGNDWRAISIDSLEGDISGASIRAADTVVAGLNAVFQFRGSAASLNGGLEAGASEIETAAGTFHELTTDLEVAHSHRITLDASIRPTAPASSSSASTPKTDKEETDEVTLRLATRFADDWGSATIRRLAIGRGEMRWKSKHRASASWTSGVYELSGFNLHRNEQSLEIDGSYSADGTVDADVVVDRFDLAQIHAVTGMSTAAPLSGRLSTRLRARGTLQSPSIALDLKATDAAYEPYGPLTVNLRMTGDDRRMDVDKFRVQTGQTRLITASCSVPVVVESSAPAASRLDLERRFDVDLEVPELELSKLDSLIGYGGQSPLGGSVSARVVASGRLSRPVLDADVSGTDITYRPPAEEDGTRPKPFRRMGFSLGVDYNPDDSPALGFSGSATWHDQRLFDASIRTDLPVHEWLEAPPSVASLTDEFYSNQLDASVKIGPIEVDSLPVAILEDSDASGTVSANFEVTGRPLAPEASLTVDVDDFGWDRFRDIYVDIQADLKNEILTISKMFLEWDADPILRASAELPVPVRSLLLGRSVEDVPLEARVQLEPLPLTKLSPFDYTFAYLKGQVAAYLEVGGTLRDPEFVSRFALTDTHLSRRDRGTVAVQLTGRNDRVRMATVICRNDRTVLAGRAAAPVNLDPIDVAVGEEPLLLEGPLEGEFRGDRVPLANIVPPPLTRGFAEDLGGTLSVDMSLAGTWETPKPTGTLAVRDGAVTLPAYGRRFRNIQLRASADRSAIDVETFQLEDENGSVEADATLNLEDFSPTGVDANAKAKDFDLTGFAAGYTAFVSGDVTVDGDFSAATYAFDIDVAGLEVELPESQPRGSYPTALESDIVVMEEADGQTYTIDLESLTTGVETGPSYTLKLDVDLDRESWVRHPNGDVNFTGAVDVEMTPTLLTLSGGVDTLRGDFEFLGRDFTIPNKTDVIRFTGAYPPNPRLNIEAIHPLDQNIAEEIGQATGGEPQISVRITGTAYEPRMAMESDPAMTESEIIFVLMTGRPPSDAGVGEDEGVASQAVAAASGLFAGLLQQQLRGSFPVDMVRLETGSNGLENSSLRVGKYITTNLFISSAYQFAGQDDEGGFTTRVEYHFLPSWMLEAKYGDDNTGEFNIFWDLY